MSAKKQKKKIQSNKMLYHGYECIYCHVRNSSVWSCIVFIVTQQANGLSDGGSKSVALTAKVSMGLLFATTQIATYQLISS